MTKGEWNRCTIPQMMLDWLHQQGKLSERKARLFAVACCRRIWHLLDPAISGSRLDIHPRTLVEVAERCADGDADERELRAAQHASSIVEAWHPAGAACNAAQLTVPRNALVAAPIAAKQAIRAVSARIPDDPDMVEPNDPDIEAVERAAHVAFLRCIFGNPFQFAPTIDPAWLAWNDGTVIHLAQAICDERKMPDGTFDTTRLAILADALEEAEADPMLFEHLRQQGIVHVRGCWCIDLPLGKT